MDTQQYSIQGFVRVMDGKLGFHCYVQDVERNPYQIYHSTDVSREMLIQAVTDLYDRFKQAGKPFGEPRKF